MTFTELFTNLIAFLAFPLMILLIAIAARITDHLTEKKREKDKK